MGIKTVTDLTGGFPTATWADDLRVGTPQIGAIGPIT
jgi:hypothetical protein